METAALTNEQRLSIALKVVHETMLQKPISYSEIMNVLKTHKVKNVSASVMLLKKDGVIKRIGKPGRGATYSWSDGVNSNLPLAKRLSERAKSYTDLCNVKYAQKLTAANPNVGIVPTLFPATPEKQLPDVTTLIKRIAKLEKEISETSKRANEPAVKIPKKRIRIQSPVKISFGIKLRKMIYFI